jgi:hypothetical protein
MLNRDELERELVVYDKQKLITQCLKLFDSNKSLSHIIEGQVEKIRILEAEKQTDTVEIDRLNSRRWVTVLNESIRKRTVRIRNRNELRKAKRQAK